MTPASFLTSGLTHPLCLDIWLRKQLGPYYDMDSEVVFVLACQAANTNVISEVNRSKIDAVKAVFLNDLPFTHWPSFEKVIMSLNGVIPMPDVCQKPDLGQLLAGVGIMDAIRTAKLSDEVCRYISAALMADDIFLAPKQLEECNKIIRPLSNGMTDFVAKNISDDKSTDQIIQWHRQVIVLANNYVKEFAERFASQYPFANGA
jgi:hypothetical protein